LFDLDGTLLDSVSFLRGAFQDFVNSSGIAGPVDPREYDGLSIRGIATALMRGSDHPEKSAQLADKYVRIIQHAYEANLQPFSGASDVLTSLQKRGLKLGLVTSAIDKMVAPLLARIGWGAIFDVVVCGNGVSQTKPAPDCYLAALASLSLAPEDVVAIEDSANGVLAARGAGLTVIGVSSADHAAVLRAAGAWHTVAAIENVADLVFSGESAG
jgi:HAD superfamily hydrolase (TIGR01509 family)